MSDKKVIQLDDRIPKLKAMRRQKSNRRFVFYITIFFLLVLVVTYIESPLSNVKNIQIVGNRYVPEDTIKATSGLTTKSKIWNVNQTKVKRALTKIPSIKTVKVKSHFFSGQVNLTVTEYKRVAYVKKGSVYKEVLANGKFMTPSNTNETPVNAPILIGFQEGKALNKLADQLNQLKPAMLYDLSEIDFTPTSLYPNGITLYLNDGHRALADSTTLANKMKLYPSILPTLPKNEDGVVELRVGAYWSPAASNPNASSNPNGGA